MCNGICPAVFDMTDDGVAKAVDEEVKIEDARRCRERHE